jgi:hypothetical protein
MLRSMKNLENYAIHATDGAIGHVQDFYFDDRAWVVRYLVVETGSWLSSRKVLISPLSIGQPNWAEKLLPVWITREQVKNSPDIDTDKPVSRQHEIQYLGFYGYPYYWSRVGIYGGGAYPGVTLLGLGDHGSDAECRTALAENDHASTRPKLREDGDPHLRSAEAIMKYHVEATDGGIGHVQGLLVDEDTWAVRYLVVDTSNWWLGHQVLIAPRWLKEVRWIDRTVSVDLTQQAVKDAPPYESVMPLSREQELALHNHHDRIGYWADKIELENPEYHAALLARNRQPAAPAIDQTRRFPHST